MNHLSEIANKLKAVQNSMDGIMNAEMFKNESVVRKWIRERWLTGFNSDGTAIGLYRFEEYAEQKNAMSSLAGFGNVDLTYSGVMGRAIQIDNFNGDYKVFSTVGHYDEIVEKYGEANFNITDIEKEKLNDIIFNVIFNEINKSYG